MQNTQLLKISDLDYLGRSFDKYRDALRAELYKYNSGGMTKKETRSFLNFLKAIKHADGQQRLNILRLRYRG